MTHDVPVRSLAALVATKTGPLYVIGHGATGELEPPLGMTVHLFGMLVTPVWSRRGKLIAQDILYLGEEGTEGGNIDIQHWAKGTWDGENHIFD